MKDARVRKIMKVRGADAHEEEDSLANEGRLNITVNGIKVVSMFCTPTMLRELAVGFVMSEGIAEGVCMDRMTLMHGEEESTVEMHAEGEVDLEGGTVTSGCVGGMSFGGKKVLSAHEDGLKVEVSALRASMKRFLHKDGLYTETGCAHRAALLDGDDVISYAEDIGRHNAVDKVIGGAILEGEKFTGKVLFASGRLSSEIVSKCAAWGIPIVASRAAPTERAVKIAQDAGVTLVGFMRGERFNIYCHPQRIKL
ncbi:MAG: formate dehydrogenase accessory sulfurtransferase FdhD [Thermodesulfovibrionales bacterium]|nr:formate dehydrogenase accessory sulfurtransferase FdhD [Thermodesulfovibrionales bacterium]